MSGSQDTSGGSAATEHRGLTLAFTLVVFAVFAFALYGALGMNRGARFMPMVISSLGLGLSALAVLRELFGGGQKQIEGVDIDEMSSVSPLRALRFGGWMIGYIALLWLAGLIASTLIFAAAFLRVERRASPLVIVIVSAIALTLALVLGRLLNIRWPAGFLTF